MKKEWGRKVAEAVSIQVLPDTGCRPNASPGSLAVLASVLTRHPTVVANHHRCRARCCYATSLSHELATAAEATPYVTPLPCRFAEAPPCSQFSPSCGFVGFMGLVAARFVAAGSTQRRERVERGAFSGFTLFSLPTFTFCFNYWDPCLSLSSCSVHNGKEL